MFRLVIHVEDKRLADILKLLVGKVEMPEPPQPIVVSNGASKGRSLEAVISQLRGDFTSQDFRDAVVAVGYSEGNAPNLLSQAHKAKLIVHKGVGKWRTK